MSPDTITPETTVAETASAETAPTDGAPVQTETPKEEEKKKTGKGRKSQPRYPIPDGGLPGVPDDFVRPTDLPVFARGHFFNLTADDFVDPVDFHLHRKALAAAIAVDADREIEQLQKLGATPEQRAMMSSILSAVQAGANKGAANAAAKAGTEMSAADLAAMQQSALIAMLEQLQAAQEANES